ncbi:MAG: hypothetical protein A2000_01820 [Ignavibacteria bacterium GWB2_36_8]|nr:MAG: hypothetical protein A2000_01820 [Ignavibacteria bacterium GWB2_36_8]OGU48630.1 MAG: hypothetical protein A2080_13110 [Ignavibacteria bacterium GWC2_36_12]
MSFIYLLVYSGLISLNIDFLFFKFEGGKIAGVPVGEMSFYTALAFFLSAVSTLFITIRSKHRLFENVSMVSSIVVISLGLFFLSGYFLGRSIIYVGSFIPMAINTATCFLLTGISTLLLMLSDEVTRLKSLKELNMAVPLYKKIWGGFALAFSAIIIISIVSFNNSLRYIGATEKIELKHKTLTEIEVIVSDIKDIALGTSGFVITGNDFFIAQYPTSAENVRSRLNSLRLLAGEDIFIRNYLDTLQILLEQRLKLDEQLITSGKENDGQALIISGNGEAIMDSIRSVIKKVENYEQAELKNLYQEKEFNFKSNIITFSTLILVVLTIISILYFLIKKELFVRQKAEEETRQLNVKLEAVNKELESFTYTVSHDLRAPVRHINGFLDILHKNISEKLDKENLRYFNLIKESTKDMGNLIDDLLTFSRTAKAELNKTKLNLNEAVHQVIQNIQHGLEGKNVEWITDELPEVYGDYTLIKVVLVNLISNAVKFTSKTANPVVTIGSQKYDKIHVIFIKDNGVGFNMNYYSKLFGVFQRLHDTGDFPGTGIGLATVKKIIEKHNGKVWAKSKEGEGATFFFSLPLY